MPATAVAIHPTGLGITFTEADHSYIDGNGQHYTSGTSVVKLVKPQFDPDGSIAKRCAERAGITPEQMKAQWKAKGDNACRLGTRAHEHAEDLFLQRPPRHSPEDQDETVRFWAIGQMVTYLLQTCKLLAVEQIVFSPSMWVAGTIDLLMVDHLSKTVYVYDWKTNETIDRHNRYGGKLMAPLAHLDDCALNHYALQMGLYRYIIEHEGYLAANGLDGYKVRCALLHVQPEVVSRCDVPELASDVRDMIIRHLTNVPF